MNSLLTLAMRLPEVTALLETIQQQIDRDLPYKSELAVNLLNLVFYEYVTCENKEYFDELVSYSLDRDALDDLIPKAVLEIEAQIGVNGVCMDHLDHVKILNDDGDFIVYLNPPK